MTKRWERWEDIAIMVGVGVDQWTIEEVVAAEFGGGKLRTVGACKLRYQFLVDRMPKAGEGSLKCVDGYKHAGGNPPAQGRLDLPVTKRGRREKR